MAHYKLAAKMIISFRIQDISAKIFSNRKVQSVCLNFIPKPNRQCQCHTVYGFKRTKNSTKKKYEGEEYSPGPT